MADQGELKSIRADQLELDLGNSRHERFSKPSLAIEYLVTRERVVDLAIDIAAEGTNPMDVMGVVVKKPIGTKPVYISVEGNRRTCAIMLLHDPEKIPPNVPNRSKLVKRLEAAISKGSLPSTINVIVFKSKKQAKPWIERMHLPQGSGRSRRSWTPEQQDRAMGGGRNRDAAALLDLAQDRGLIDRQERDRKLTTVQRYLSNPAMRHSLGLLRDGDKYLVDREPDEFKAIFEKFLDDIKSGDVSSRSKSKDIIAYGKSLESDTGVSNDRIDPIPLSTVLKAADKKLSTQPDEGGEDQKKTKKIRPRSSLTGTPALEAAFAELGNQKLQSLYLSCVRLSLSTHAPLITVGLWSMLESLASLHAAGDKPFVTYFSGNMMDRVLGIGSRTDRKDISAALKYISEKGNATKHSSVAGSFDTQQLANDFDVLVPLFLAVIADLNARKTEGSSA